MQSYQRTYVERDARILADIEDWSQFIRFFRLAAALSAQEINHSEFGRDIGINPQTAKRWLAILAGTFQWIELPAFSGNAVKKMSGKPKGMLHDTGLICALQSIASPAALSGHPAWGSIFETAVTMEIKKQLSASGLPAHLIEIKGKANPTRRDAQGIESFRSTYPKRKIALGLIFCLCEKSYPLTENVWVVPAI